MACKSSGGSSFSEALSYALRRLKMTRITVKDEQRSSMRAVYEGSDVFVWLATYRLWQEPVLPSAPFPHGLMENLNRRTNEITVYVILSHCHSL